MSMDQRALLEKFERDKKEKQMKEEKEAKKQARIARQQKVRADQHRRAREKDEAIERKQREAREKLEREERERQERECYFFTVERDKTGHFPSIEHKCQIIAGGETMREVYRNVALKLGITRKDFVVMVMNKKTFEFHEMDDIKVVNCGKRYEQRARLQRREDVWFPDPVGDKTLCCLCGDEIGTCRRRFHHGNISHKSCGVETRAFASKPLPPDCRNYRDALRYHLSKFRPETRNQICGACYAFNLMQSHRESVMYDDHPLNALDPWGRSPLTADGQQWHYFTDPAVYRHRNVLTDTEVARAKRKQQRQEAIEKYNAAAGERREEALQRCGMAPKPAAATALALLGGSEQLPADEYYDQGTYEYPQLQY